MAKDLHDKPFDDATLLKLEIFEKYFEAWLPTFLYAPFEGDIQIWDFFAGQGYDMGGVGGSPIRILQVIEKFKTDIKKTNKKIHLIFNELDKQKHHFLSLSVEAYFEKMEDIKDYVEINIENKKFELLFAENQKRLSQGNNLIFIDQNGVKQVTETVFEMLCRFKRTDFIFFISSSYFKRFGEEFKQFHPKLDLDKVSKSEYKKIHLEIHALFQQYADDAKQDMYLFPFSIQKKLDKGFSIYGLVFGAKHIAAAVKFLDIVWKKNPINGIADYDIEEETRTSIQIDMFTGVPKMTKIAKFQEDLEDHILNRILKTNRDVFIFTYKSGHISEHAKQVVLRLKEQKRIHFTGQPLISYDAWQKKNLIHYEIL